MNGKVLKILFLAFVLLSLISCTSEGVSRGSRETRVAPFDVGQVTSGFSRGLDRIEDFFRGGWQNYERTMAFFVFFFLFFSAYLIGLKKVYGEKELNRPQVTFAFVAAFSSAFIIAVSVRFDWINWEYVAWFLITILILFGLYTLLSKMGLEKHKFWAFLLALILTALLLWLLWYLMNEGRPLDGLGRISDWFGDLGKRARIRKAGGVVPEKVTRPTTTPTTGPGKGPEEGRGFWTWAGIILLVVLILGGGGHGIKRVYNWRKGKSKFPEGERPEGRGFEERGPGVVPPREPIEKVINLLKRLLRRKNFVYENLSDLEEKKKRIIDKLPTLINELKKAGGINKFFEEKAPYLMQPGSKGFNARKEEAEGIEKVIRDNHMRMRYLRLLFGIEDYIVKNVDSIANAIQNQVGEDKKQTVFGLFEKIKNISAEIMNKLREVFKIEAKEENVEKRIIELLSKEHMMDRVKEKWIDAESKSKEGLKNLIGEEFNIYRKIKKLLYWEKKRIDEIIRILEGAEEKIEKKREEEKVPKKPVIKGGIAPIKVPIFVSSESQMIELACCEEGAKKVSKEILDTTYRDVLSRMDEIHNKELSEVADKIKLRDSNRFAKQYVKRREIERNPYRGRNINEVLKLIGEICGWLTTNWERNIDKTVKRRIEIIRESGQDVPPFTTEAYEDKGLLVSPSDATRLQFESQRVAKDKDEIARIEKLERAWRVWWNMFGLGVWQINRLIKAINRAGLSQETKQQPGEVIPVKIKRVSKSNE